MDCLEKGDVCGGGVLGVFLCWVVSFESVLGDFISVYDWFDLVYLSQTQKITQKALYQTKNVQNLTPKLYDIY
jgi:hypothetical protein